MAEYVRNCWYMAAWVREVPEDGFLARKLLDRSWLLWRNPDDSWALVEDRCPHRFVPLSRGRFADGRIACGYHGLTFDGTGACVHNPFGHAVPDTARISAMPVVERHGALWFWPGDAGRADPATIPDFAFVESGPATGKSHYVMGVNYELIADNLLDLSHAEFLHVESFGTNGSLFSHGAQTVVQDDTGAIWNKWDMTGAPPPGWALPMLGEGATVDQILHIRWHAPASLALFIRMTRSGGAEVIAEMVNPHILTPETQHSTHYFFTHEPGPEAEAMARRVFLEEDEPMIAAQAEAMGDADFWVLKPLILPSDAAAIRARRRMMQLRRAEQ
ncbi:aromatic ring-hydroxylating dioxygenase subunit alpha [Novosphingobium huizhouense]|uniref:aromatic ring-hydroxylating dioxygenase subunit alpha n=1 Tax=Novosphingobium huizhouense TaxID=2866625 RepID=UPI001CD83781|nr:aromatic ring-hydroxylating dioxygenase subunit alpha [Novosphingobium huizhouense]